jgi:hypothetical protein
MAAAEATTAAGGAGVHCYVGRRRRRAEAGFRPNSIYSDDSIGFLIDSIRFWIDSIGFGSILSVSDRFYRFWTDSIGFGSILSVSD